MKLLVAALAALLCVARAQDDLDGLISSVFPAPADKNAKPNAGPAAGGVNLDPNAAGNAGPVQGTGNCECVPYYLCKDGEYNKGGEGIIDIRIQQGPCQNYLEICCEVDKKTTTPVKPPEPIKQHPTGCGYRNAEGVGFRITGDKDNESQFGEFPWMVAILREEPVEGSSNKLNVYQCGGALIHPRAVVTAAHCVLGKAAGKKFKIRAGEWDTQTKNEILPHQDRDVEQVITHEQYHAGALYNDVAVLILKTPLDLTDNVNVICLPTQDAAIDHKQCFASGWGKDVFGKEGKYQVILKKVELPIVKHGPCQDALRKTRLGKFFELHRSFVCAGGQPGKDTCKGDGGSPLVCPIPGKAGQYQHAGIVAWGIGCGETGTPGVYANVAHFRNWIDEQMAYNRLEMTTYTY